MLQNDMFVGGQFAWFIGEVRDIDDPLKLNRVKVMPYGYYDERVPTEHLPWATVMMPNTSANKAGIGENHSLLVGSWVAGFFRDGPSAQDPLIIGSIASKTQGTTDIPVETQENYPYNKVHKTESGHVIEYDNTPESERIQITHKEDHSLRMLNGSVRLRHRDNHTLTMDEGVVEIRHKTGTLIRVENDGTINIDASNDIVNIDGNTTITGTLHVTETTHSVGDISTDAGNAPTLATHVHKSISQDTGAGTNSGKKKDTTVADA